MNNIGDITTKIASLTSIRRTTTADEQRTTLHGGTNQELYKRVDSAATQLRKIATELEKTIA